MKPASGRIRVLHLFPHDKGNYPLLMDMIRGLNPERYESTVCYIDRLTDEPNPLREEGYPVFHLLSNRSESSVSAISVTRWLRTFLREHPSDIIHSQRHSTTVQTLLATMGMPRPPILFHVHARARYRRFQRKLSGFWIARKISRFVAVSESVRHDLLDSLWGIAPEKVVTVQNGIDPGPFTDCEITREEARALFGLPSEGFLVGSVGRFDPKKAQKDLIEALHRLRVGGANVYLAFAGEGRLRPQLESQIASLDLKGRVFLLGRRKEIPSFLRALDVFALTSLREGLPLALLEAMASGLPVVSTRAGGASEAAEGLEGAVLVEPGDVSGIADGLRRMYDISVEERRRRGLENRDRVLVSFTSERMVRDMERVYEDVLKGER